MAQQTIRNTLRSVWRSAVHTKLLETSNKCFPATTACKSHIQTQCPNKSAVDKKILSLSSIILQDGLEIQELPIIVNRASRTFSPFSNIMSSIDNIKKISEQDENFKLNLQSCRMVKEVYKLLEVPSDQVTGYSAAFALQRISQLHETSVALDGDGIDTFIRTAVMNELYDTVIRDMENLANDTVINLVKCYLLSANFNPACAERINTEIESRIGDGRFTILEVCGLSNSLCRHKKGDPELIQKLWADIGMRAEELQEGNITEVYRSLPVKHKYLLKVLNRRLLQFWWKLKGEDVASIVPCLVRLKNDNRKVLSAFGKWVFMNIHSVTEGQLMNIVAGFVQFDFSDPSLIRALERYLPAKGSKLDISLLSLAMEYNRSRRYFSPCILDTAARHFEKRYKDYKPLQAYSVLRPFGYLNYVPSNSGVLFLRIEEYLSEWFQYFSIAHMSELLCSFTYINRFPVNFIKHVFSPTFLSKVNGLNDPQLRLQTGRWLEMFQSAMLLEAWGARIAHLYKLENGTVYWLDGRHNLVHQQLYETLEGMIGKDKIRKAKHAQKSVYFIDFAIHCHPSGTPMPQELIKRMNPEYGTKIALLIQMPENYCVNTGHILGEYTMRNRHLKLLGYDVVELMYDDVQQLYTAKQREKYLKSKLYGKMKHRE